MSEQKDTTSELTEEEFKKMYGETPLESLKKSKRRRRIRTVAAAILFLCLAVALVYIHMIKTNEEKLDKISPDIIEDYDGGSENAPLAYYIIDGVCVQKGLKDLYLQNSDVKGWIRIPDTKIDYPILQSSLDDPEFYLHRSFDKSYYIGGSIFADADCDTVRPSENVILYGHHMSDGSGFKSLSKYEKESYYDGHKIIWCKTLTGNAKYEVVAAYRTSTHDGDFKFWEYTDMGKERFDTYMEECVKRTPYDISTEASYGDSLLTLATCAYHIYNGRYVVVAKRVGFQSIDTSKKPIAVITTHADGTYTEVAE